MDTFQSVIPEDTHDRLLRRICTHLLERFDVDAADRSLGGIVCRYCGRAHIRALEACWAFAYLASMPDGERFSRPAVLLGNAAVKRQERDGHWEEADGEWPGISVFILMSLAAALPPLEKSKALDPAESAAWRRAVDVACVWVEKNVSERTANINYLAGAAAALALSADALSDNRWMYAARRFAIRAAARINRDGLIDGEGVYSPLFGRRGIDIGYGLDMTLAALALYLKLVPAPRTARKVQRAIEAHLAFVYPDGVLDNSFGSRSFKWQPYGSKTAHGSQMAFALAPFVTPGTLTASRLTASALERFLDENHFAEPSAEPLRKVHHRCIYPLFCRANNLAFVLKYRSENPPAPGPLPSHRAPYRRHFPSINVRHVRTRGIMATISGYANRPRFAGGEPYPTPCGGTVTLLWHHLYGIAQAATQTEYAQVEKLHVPQADGVECLTPRIEFSEGGRLFSSAYDHAAAIVDAAEGAGFVAGARGKLRDRARAASRVGFDTALRFDDDSLRKIISVTATQGAPIRIVEPIVTDAPEKTVIGDDFAVFHSRQGVLQVRWTSEGFALAKSDISVWANPFPLLQAVPLIFVPVSQPSRKHLELLFSFDN